jgi:Transposase DDE domain
MAHRIKRPSRGLASSIERLFGAALGERESRVQGWTSVALAVVWLFQSFSRGATLEERFQDARRWLRTLLPGRRRESTYQGFVKALRRTPILAEWIAAAFRERLREWSGPGWRIGGWVPLAMDGTRFECPRSKSCQRAFRLASRPKSAPQLVLVSLWHLGVQAWFDFRVAAARVGERTLARDLAGGLPTRTLLVGDAGFIGYDFCVELERGGVSFLLRVGSNVTLLSNLGAWEHRGRGVVHLWPGDKRQRRPFALRLLIVGRGAKKVYLATNVLDPFALSKKQAAEFYRQRWVIETGYRAVKQTLLRRTLKSRAADLTKLELVGVVLGHWTLALLALKARGATLATCNWSTAKAAAALRTVLQDGTSRADWRTAWRRVLLAPPKRRGLKKRRQQWPKAKHDPPCGAPTVRPANPSELSALKRLAAAFVW